MHYIPHGDNNEKDQNRLHPRPILLPRCVHPVLSLYQDNADKLIRHSVDCAKMIDIVKRGDRVVITSGEMVRSSGNTNLLKVEIVQ